MRSKIVKYCMLRKHSYRRSKHRKNSSKLSVRCISSKAACVRLRITYAVSSRFIEVSMKMLKKPLMMGMTNIYKEDSSTSKKFKTSSMLVMKRRKSSLAMCLMMLTDRLRKRNKNLQMHNATMFKRINKP